MHAATPPGTKKVNFNDVQLMLLRQRICNMFRRYVPTKLHKLELALARYEGREDALLRALIDKFGPEPAFTAEQQQISEALEEKADSLDSSGAVRAKTTSPSKNGSCTDFFPATVALVAQHHQNRSRLFETYSAKRSVLRLQEEREREMMVRQFSIEQRHLQTCLTRKQAETILFAQKEKVVVLEHCQATRRQEEMRASAVMAFSASLAKRCFGKRDEIANDERSERRALVAMFSEDLAVLYRLQIKMAKIRELEDEERGPPSAEGNPQSDRSRTRSRQRKSIEDEIRSLTAGRIPGSERKRSSKGAEDDPLLQFCEALGTKVSASFGTMVNASIFARHDALESPIATAKSAIGQDFHLPAIARPQ
jgi:hypothetical protein